MRRLVDRATARRVDASVAVSEAVARALIAAGARSERVRVVPNGVDVDALERLASAPFAGALPDGSGPLVVCTARLEPVKGVEYLLRAVALLPDVRLAIAGDGSLKADLRKLATSLGVADRTSFLGHVSPVAPLLATASVVVLPSLSEGMPMVSLEAMALSRPVVASSVGGVPEVVGDGSSGLLVPPCDAVRLAEAIRAVTHDLETAKRMGALGREQVEARFTARHMASGYVALIEELTRG